MFILHWSRKHRERDGVEGLFLGGREGGCHVKFCEIGAKTALTLTTNPSSRWRQNSTQARGGGPPTGLWPRETKRPAPKGRRLSVLPLFFSFFLSFFLSLLPSPPLPSLFDSQLPAVVGE